MNETATTTDLEQLSDFSKYELIEYFADHEAGMLLRREMPIEMLRNDLSEAWREVND